MTPGPGSAGTRTELSTVAVIGTGVIGNSWAAQFLARGLDVIAVDPGDGAEDRLREYVERVWPTMRALGLAWEPTQAGSGSAPARPGRG